MAFLDFENLQVSLKTDILTRALIAYVKLYTTRPQVPPKWSRVERSFVTSTWPNLFEQLITHETPKIYGKYSSSWTPIERTDQLNTVQFYRPVEHCSDN